MPEIASLPLFHQIAGQRVLVLGDGAAAEPKRRLVARAGGIVIEDERQAIDEGVRLAFVAFDDAKACEVAAINLRCAGMIVNVVDRPDLCDFTTPSILERGPLLIAVGTGGASAGLAKHIRLRLERILPQTLGLLADALSAVRPVLRARLPDGAERRRAIDTALREGGALDPLDETSHARVEDWAKGDLRGGRSEGAAASVHIVLTSDDPEDLTLRQARWLGEADSVCAQGPVPAAILARARADAARIVCDTPTCATYAALAGEAHGDDAAPDRNGVEGSGGGVCALTCPRAEAISGGAQGLTVILQAKGNRPSRRAGSPQRTP